MANESRLGLLWKKHLCDELTKEEWDELAKTLSTDEGKKFFIDNSEEDRVILHLGYLDLMNDKQIWSKIDQEMRAKPTYKWIYLSAACLVGMIFMAGYLFYSQKQRPEIHVVTKAATLTNIAPGGHSATLTLGNGHQIDLDAAAQGVIAEEGKSKVFKVASGRLEYAGRGAEAQGNFNTVATDRGGMYKVTLSDGTRIWLDAESSIRFPVSFAGNNREVELTGQVYIEVKKDRELPFKVKVGDSYVNVLGTRFNVRAYPDHEPTTTLLEGSVQVRKGNQSVTLIPGEEVKMGKVLTVSSVENINDVAAWKDGYFQWENADIETIMNSLSRWYDFKTQYQGHFDYRTFSGKMSRDLSLAQVLQILETNGIHFRVERKTVYVLP